jgi:hypothetical protein
METVGGGSGGQIVSRATMHVAENNDNTPAHHWFFALESLSPYMDVVRRSDGAPLFWSCPSWRERLNYTPADDAAVYDNGWDTSYCYFGRADLWPQDNVPPLTTSNLGDLTGRTLEADELLMCDFLFRYQATDAWYFSHGTHSSYQDGVIGDPQTSVVGQNELYGDGHVVWASGTGMAFAATAPPGVGAQYYGNITFWIKQ